MFPNACLSNFVICRMFSHSHPQSWKIGGNQLRQILKKKKKNLENCVRFEETAQHDSDSVILHVFCLYDSRDWIAPRHIIIDRKIKHQSAESLNLILLFFQRPWRQYLNLTISSVSRGLVETVNLVGTENLATIFDSARTGMRRKMTFTLYHKSNL